MKNKYVNQTPKDFMKIAYSIAIKRPRHPVYPTIDDMVQEMLLECLKNKKFKKYPVQSLYYGFRNAFDRVFKKYANEHNVDMEDITEPVYVEHDYSKEIENKLKFNKFLAWVKDDNVKDMYKMRYTGKSFREIGEKYGCSKQNIEIKLANYIKKYHKEVMKNENKNKV